LAINVIDYGERHISMTYRGRVKNGAIILDPPANLPEGAEAAVIIENALPPTLQERLKDVVGILDDLPPDLAKNHDHYIHGSPKQSP
jgi:hypothetical protein